MPHFELIDDEYIGVSFQYDRGVVNQLRQLNSRRWNPEKKRWEVHIVHLADVMKIFHLRPEDVPQEIVRRYQSQWIQSKARIRAGHSFTQIEGGHIPLDAIDEAASFPVFGREYNLMYLDGKWDGQKHLFDRRNFSFPTGLLDRVVAVLRAQGIAFEIEDQRDAEDEPWAAGPDSDAAAAAAAMERALQGLEGYPRTALEAALRARRGMIELAPGADKWGILARLIQILDRETVVFTPGLPGLEQAVAQLHERLGKRVGQIGGGETHPGGVTVVSAPAACRAFGIRVARHAAGEDPVLDDSYDPGAEKSAAALCIREAKVIVFDDTQCIQADTCYQLAMRCGAAAWRFGLAAFARRPDGHDMLFEAAFGPFVHHTSPDMLIAAGEAVPCAITVVRPVAYPACERDREPEEIFRRAILENEERHALVARRASDLRSEGMRGVAVLAHDAAHARALAAHIEKCVVVEGMEDQAGREKMKKALAAKKSAEVILLPWNAEPLLDNPRIGALVLAAPGPDEARTLERILKLMIPAPGKKRATAIDFLDPVPYLKEQGQRRLAAYQSQKGLEVQVVELDT